MIYHTTTVIFITIFQESDIIEYISIDIQWEKEVKCYNVLILFKSYIYVLCLLFIIYKSTLLVLISTFITNCSKV